MKYILILCSCIMSSQVKMTFNENISGAYNTTNRGEQFIFTINSQNKLEYKKFYADFNPYFMDMKSAGVTSSKEFLSKQDIGFKVEKNSVFYVSQFNSSLIRSIEWDAWNGIGIGRKLINTNRCQLSLSYCFEQEQRKYKYEYVEKIYRNSFRSKMALKYSLITFTLEYFYQPTFNTNDMNFLGTSTAIFFPEKSINFIIQNNINYISTDNVKTIQNTTFGIKINLSNDKKL